VTSVDFYILPSEHESSFRNFVCKIVEKSYNRYPRTVLLVDNLDDARLFDDLLWTFRQGSFIPHGMGDSPALSDVPPVHIATSRSDTTGAANVLVNVSSVLPSAPANYDRIIEIVDKHPTRRTQGRDRYRHYRELGLSLETHDLSRQSASLDANNNY